MKVLSNKRKDNTVSLEIEAPYEALETAMDKVFRRVVKTAKVPGFRKGHIPRGIFEKHYGRGVLLQDAIMDVVNLSYSKAIDELSLKVIDYPTDLDVKEYKESTPIKFSLNVQVEPVVKLPKYKGLKVKREKEAVDDARMNEEIDRLRESYAAYDVVETAIEADSIVRAKLEANLANGSAYAPWTRDNIGLKIGLGTFGKAFDDAILGLKKDDEKTFNVTYEDDFDVKEIAGQTLSFKISITEVRSKTLPELDAEFVKKVSQHETVDAFKTELRDALEKRAQEESDQKLKNALLDAILEDLKLDVPEKMIETEMNRHINHLESQVKQAGSTLDRYLALTGKTLEQIREEYKEQAEKNVKSDLVLLEIGEKEGITPNEKDLIQEVKSWNLPQLKTDEDLAKYATASKHYLEEIVKRKKIFDFLIENAKIS